MESKIQYREQKENKRRVIYIIGKPSGVPPEANSKPFSRVLSTTQVYWSMIKIAYS